LPRYRGGQGRHGDAAGSTVARMKAKSLTGQDRCFRGGTDCLGEQEVAILIPSPVLSQLLDIHCSTPPSNHSRAGALGKEHSPAPSACAEARERRGQMMYRPGENERAPRTGGCRENAQARGSSTVTAMPPSGWFSPVILPCRRRTSDLEAANSRLLAA